MPPFLDDPGLAARPHAIYVWDQDLDGFVWANHAGLNRWGALSLASFRASRLDRAMPAMATLRNLSRMALPIEGVIQTLTFWTSRGACRITCRCRPLDLNDAGHGLLLEAMDTVETELSEMPSQGHALNGHHAHLPPSQHTSSGRVPPPVTSPPRVPGFLSGTEATEETSVPQPGTAQEPVSPATTDEDRFAMQEIARMLGNGGQTERPVHQVAKAPVQTTCHAGSMKNGVDAGAYLRDTTTSQAAEHTPDTQTESKTSETQNGITSAPLETSRRAGNERFDTLNHELRTPLNSIIGFAEMMHREQLGPIGVPRYKEYAGDILDSARHALSLINDLLDASRVRAGHLDVATEDVDVPILLDRVIALLEPQAKDASVTVVRGYPPSLPHLEADARALRQILLNILTNAFKFTPAGGHVFVSTQMETEHMILDLRDTGIGMTDEQIDEAQKPWVRSNGDIMPGDAPVGSGLGLPLVKALTEAQGGSLSITSAPGEGTSVRIRLPLPRSDQGLNPPV